MYVLSRMCYREGLKPRVNSDHTPSQSYSNEGKEALSKILFVYRMQPNKNEDTQMILPFVPLYVVFCERKNYRGIQIWDHVPGSESVALLLLKE
jgi:hypothetical protein